MTTTRFAPSPTGYLHVGNLRTALMNWLIAAQAGGRFILRLDDTDPERSSDRFAAAIEEDLDWLGLRWDALVRQSDRLDRYAGAAAKLRAAGRLYECFETPDELELKRRTQLSAGRPPVYDRAALALDAAERDRLRAVRSPHWRFLLDRERVAWHDAILGPTSIDAASVSDPVLIRGDGQVLYTLASVVDDLDLGITDIVRGADHVTNTATQVQIFAVLGDAAPRFAHHSLLTGAGGEALSKRLGTLSLRDLRARGVEPMALVSLLARLGSSEPVVPFGTLEEAVAGFDISRFGSAPTRFDPDDLAPMSARILRARDYPAVAGALAELGVPADVAPAFWDAVRENVAMRGDIGAWWDVCQGRFETAPDHSDAEFVAQALDMLPPRPWDDASWGAWTAAVRDATGRKGRALFQPLRRALTGRDSGPDMATLMPLLRRTGAGSDHRG